MDPLLAWVLVAALLCVVLIVFAGAEGVLKKARHRWVRRRQDGQQELHSMSPDVEEPVPRRARPPLPPPRSTEPRDPI